MENEKLGNLPDVPVMNKQPILDEINRKDIPSEAAISILVTHLGFIETEIKEYFPGLEGYNGQVSISARKDKKKVNQKKGDSDYTVTIWGVDPETGGNAVDIFYTIKLTIDKEGGGRGKIRDILSAL